MEETDQKQSHNIKDLIKEAEDDVAREKIMSKRIVNQISNSMSEESKTQYKKVGQHMYNESLEDKLDKALWQIDCALRSGLMPEELTKNERAILKAKLGEEWYKKYDFEESDIPNTE